MDSYGHYEQQQQPGQQDDYRPQTTHNIFDMGAPASMSNFSSQQHQQHPQQPPAHQQQPPQYPSGTPTDYNFNSTLPALNSSSRYDEPPPPSSYHHHPYAHARQTPSPHSEHGPAQSRSRSRSRDGVGSWGDRGIGPHRRSRASRSSFSSTSPPRPNPGAINIPVGLRGQTPISPSLPSAGTPISPIGMHSINNGPWGGSASSATASEYGMPPTPDSLGGLQFHLPPPSTASPHPTAQQDIHHPHQNFSSFGPFGGGLPPLNELPKDQYAHQQHFHNMPPGTAIPPLSSSPYAYGSVPSDIHHNFAGPPNGHAPGTSAPVSSTTRGKKAGGAGGKEDKASAIANEKKRRRRESHNAVERRRRDNINEKISELATLIPECMLDSATPVQPPSLGSINENGSSATVNGDPATPSIETEMNGAPALTLDTTSAEMWATNALKKEGISNIPEESLNGLLPLPGSPTSPTSPSIDGKDKDANVVKANKGMILRKSVEYIRYLQQLVSVQGARNRELEAELKNYRGPGSGSGSVSAMGMMGMGMGMGLPMGMGGMGMYEEVGSQKDGMNHARTPSSSISAGSPHPSATSATATNSKQQPGPDILTSSLNGNAQQAASGGNTNGNGKLDPLSPLSPSSSSAMDSPAANGNGNGAPVKKEDDDTGMDVDHFSADNGKGGAHVNGSGTTVNGNGGDEDGEGRGRGRMKGLATRSAAAAAGRRAEEMEV